MVKPAIAIIPARGGSKRIPRKNIIEFHGQPMIARTIKAALQSNCFSRVVVSTDDQEIADISKDLGAEAPFLRQTHFDDQATISEAILAALQQAQQHWGEDYGLIAQLMPNCPLRGAAEIKASIRHFRSHDSDFQISCFKFGWNNPWWAAELDDQGRPSFLFTDRLKARSQDLPELYCPTGAIWLAESAALAEAGTFYGKDVVFCPISWQAAIDIDEPGDLDIARKLFSP